jgi:hypothetical protein
VRPNVSTDNGKFKFKFKQIKLRKFSMKFLENEFTRGEIRNEILKKSNQQ